MTKSFDRKFNEAAFILLRDNGRDVVLVSKSAIFFLLLTYFITIYVLFKSSRRGGFL